MACSSVRSSKVATTLLSNGLTVRYPIVFRPFGLRRLRATVTADLAFKRLVEILPSRAGKSRYRVRLSSAGGRRRCRGKPPDQEVRTRGRVGLSSCTNRASRLHRRLTGTRTSRTWPQPANSSRWASVADDHALARLASTRGREMSRYGCSAAQLVQQGAGAGGGSDPGGRSAFSHWAKVVMTPS